MKLEILLILSPRYKLCGCALEPPGSRAFLPLHQDADGVGHELVGHLQDLVRQCGADEHHLRGRGQVPVHVVNLLFETCDKR